MSRENVLSLLIELYGEAVEHRAGEERLAQIRDRIHTEVFHLQRDAVESHEEGQDALERLKEAQGW